LNDRGDDTPEGELTDGILDQLSKFERAKTAERSRRGKLRKAREGKILRGPKSPYGFRYNAAGDGLIVYEPEMVVAERIFRLAAEGLGPQAIQTRSTMKARPRQRAIHCGRAGRWSRYCEATFIRPTPSRRSLNWSLRRY
jgi:site-specific DNA recombinase